MESQIVSQKDFNVIRENYENARLAYEALSPSSNGKGVAVKSPMSGYVKSCLVKAGDYVTVGQPLMTVTKTRRLQLKAEVSERYYPALQQVSSANFKTPYSDHVYRLDDLQGRLLAYGKASAEASFYVPVTFEFDNRGDVVPGSFVEVWLLGRERQGVISLPVSALTEEQEFREIYGMDVVVIPTNKPVQRIDHDDAIYKTKREKMNAVVEDIIESHAKGQPVLVGTITIEMSEELSAMLKKRGIKHNVLNAKFHEKEAEIISHAGEIGAVTIATNMAGRGTDIVLEDGVAELGGLKIIGTERHESRRIDNQLRGRSGRQGDPGESRFYISLEDDLMRLFSSDRIASVMDKLGFKEGEMIEHSMISKSIERAQKKVEENNFGIRKRLLEYDDVMNKQRTVVYTKRRHA